MLDSRTWRFATRIAPGQGKVGLAVGDSLIMRQLFIVALLPVVACLWVPVAGGQVKNNPGKATTLDTTEQDYIALAQYKGVTGKIIALSPSGTSMTIRVEYQVQELKDPNKQFNTTPPPNVTKVTYTPQQLQKELNQIQKIKNPMTQQQRLIQLLNKLQNQQQQQQVLQMQWVQKQLQQQANNYKTVTYAKEFDLTIVPKVHVAKKMLGLEYDDKGKVKEYTEEELKKMKDDLYTDFFKATKDEVTVGLTVYLVLAKPADLKKDKDKDKADPAAKGDEKKDDKAKPGPDGKVDDKAKPDANAQDKGKPALDINDILNGKTEPNPKDKAKPGVDVNDILNGKDKAKPGIDVGDILNGKGDKKTATTPETSSNAPVVQGIIILSEPGLADTMSPGEKKKKKNE
jgi:hypothetical protein